jgi:hypothetical protein
MRSFLRAETLPVLLTVLVAAGCGGAPRKGPVPVPNPRAYSGELREWWNIYSVEFEGDKKVRTKVGYLYRKWDGKEPKEYFVETLEQETVGWVTADNKAFQIRPVPGKDPEGIDLQTNDLNQGVKKILGTPGSIELEKVTLPGQAPASPPPAAKKAR